jgi:hypothetical protein
MRDGIEERLAEGGVPVNDLVRSAADPVPPDVRERVRARVVAAGIASVDSSVRPRRLFVGIAATLVACAIATVGVGFAVQQSLPGDMLYPVKLATERAHIALTPADEQADVYLGHADERIREIERLLNAGASARALNQALDGLGDAARQAVDVEPDEASARRRAEEVLEHAEKAPPVVRDVIESALQGLEPTPRVAPPTPNVPSEQPGGGDSDSEESAAPVLPPVPEEYKPNESQDERGVEPMAVPGAGESGSDADSL